MKKNMKIVGIGVVVFVAMYSGAKMYASTVAEDKINIAIANIANYADVDYKSASVDLFGLDVHISDVVISPANSKEKVNINEIVIYDLDEESDIPLFLNISFNGIEMPIDNLGGNAERIKELGYKDNVILNASLKYRYNKETREINFNKLKIGADDAGDLDASFRLGNIGISPEEIIGVLFTFPEIILHDIKISYNDDSLVERLLELAAKEQNKNVKQMKDEAMQNIAMEIEREQDKFTRNALKEIKDFIDDPERLVISIEPKDPLPLGRLLDVNDPKDIIKLLNVKIKS